MRALGYTVVDTVVDRLLNRDSESAMVSGTPNSLHEQLGGPIPEQPGDIRDLLQTLIQVALFHQQHGDHPRYFARVPSPSSFAAVLGEWLATGFNSNVASWAGGSGPATLELVVVDWLRQLMGFPEESEGILVSGGSLANLTAISAARRTVGHGVVYLSDQTHSSVSLGLRTMGFEPENIRVLESDDAFRLPVAALATATQQDRIAGRTPRLVIASAGTTNTGAVDPLHEIADICAAENMWFHVDGAYGAPAAIAPAGRALLAGMERADSLVLDPHKWLFQPIDVGCVLVRHPGALPQTFSVSPEYLRDVVGDRGEVDFRDRSLELTRRSRAAKLWLSFQSYGVERFRHAIEKSLRMAEYAEQALRSRPDLWDVITSAQLGVVTFALRGADEAEHNRRIQHLCRSGFAAISSTVLKGRMALRMCIINPLTTEQDIDETLRRLADPVAP